jgi:hypothetical protein
MYSLRPIGLSYNQSHIAGATPLWSLWLRMTACLLYTCCCHRTCTYTMNKFEEGSIVLFFLCYVHIIRDRRPSTEACPACWAIGTKALKKCTVRQIYFVLGRLEKLRQNKNLLYRHDKPYEPTEEEPLSFVLFKSPTSVSTVSRGHHSLVSLALCILRPTENTQSGNCLFLEYIPS